VSQVNLLPPEILQRQTRARLTFLVGVVGAAVLVLIIGFYLLKTTTLSGVNHDIDAQNQSNAAIQGRIGQLQQFATLQQTAQQKEKELDSAFSYETSFSSLLEDVSRVIPPDAYLTSLTAQVSPPQAGATTTTPAIFVGSMTAGGSAASVESLSSWLTRLESVKGWENPWMTSITKQSGVYSFSSGVDLSKNVLTARGRRAVP
jgi:Tfp pilus assembly protein PilN